MIDRKLNVKTIGFLEDEETIVQNILAARGIKNPIEFLDPDISEVLDPRQTPRIEEGVKIILDGLSDYKKFFLSVDSDTDGVTSGTIMYKWLKYQMYKFGYEDFYEEDELPLALQYYVSQGKSHGLSDELLEKLESVQSDILIVMDSLDGDTQRYQKAVDLGVQVLVIDHHDISDEIPYDEVVTLVSSNRSTNPNLSGAGMVWKVCCLADEELGDPDYTLHNLTDLAAVGIIADMMEMTENDMENRAIVNYGLNHLQNETIKKIKGFYPFNSQCISYSIAPLINAACRYMENDSAFEAFIYDDFELMQMNLSNLKRCKETQDADITEIKKDLVQQIESQEQKPYFFLEIETPWGIAGLIANQISGSYQKPTFVVKKTPDGYQGSGRAKDINLRELTHEIVPSARAFGHPQAFGFFLDDSERQAFDEAMCEALNQTDFTVIEEVDCELDMDTITKDLINEVKTVDRITGTNFKPLTFMLETDGVWAEKTKNGKHLVFKCEDDFLFIKWKAAQEAEQLMETLTPETKVRFIGTLDYGNWGPKQKFRKMILSDYEILS